MALDKLVDSTQLDADLTTVANAIRTKGGTSAPLAFPAEFVSAIAAISGGGGGGGLEYEEGTYTPSEDIDRPTISFSNAHTERPTFAAMFDVSTGSASANSNYLCLVMSWYDGFDEAVFDGNYGGAFWVYKSTALVGVSGATLISPTGDTTGRYMEYWITNSSFMPSSGSTARYWRQGRTYKWVAVWK